MIKVLKQGTNNGVIGTIPESRAINIWKSLKC